MYNKIIGINFIGIPKVKRPPEKIGRCYGRQAGCDRKENRVHERGRRGSKKKNGRNDVALARGRYGQNRL